MIKSITRSHKYRVVHNTTLDLDNRVSQEPLSNIPIEWKNVWRHMPVFLHAYKKDGLYY